MATPTFRYDENRTAVTVGIDYATGDDTSMTVVVYIASDASGDTPVVEEEKKEFREVQDELNAWHFARVLARQQRLAERTIRVRLKARPAYRRWPFRLAMGGANQEARI